MFTATDIDQLILHEKKGKNWDWGALAGVLLLSVVVFLFGRFKGWGEELGYNLGNLFVSLFAPASLFKLRQRGNIVKALEILRDKLAKTRPDSEEAREIEEALMSRFRKMLEG